MPHGAELTSMAIERLSCRAAKLSPLISSSTKRPAGPVSRAGGVWEETTASAVEQKFAMRRGKNVMAGEAKQRTKEPAAPGSGG